LEKQAIIGFHLKKPREGYRRLTFMMLDADIVETTSFTGNDPHHCPARGA
jgi:hypothetical protein